MNIMHTIGGSCGRYNVQDVGITVLNNPLLAIDHRKQTELTVC